MNPTEIGNKFEQHIESHERHQEPMIRKKPRPVKELKKEEENEHKCCNDAF